jgi:hypothetical protein
MLRLHFVDGSRCLSGDKRPRLKEKGTTMKSKLALILAMTTVMGIAACSQPEPEPVMAEPVMQKY